MPNLSYRRSVHTNWTHAYLMEDREMAHTQPLPPCYYLAINKLAKLVSILRNGA